MKVFPWSSSHWSTSSNRFRPPLREKSISHRRHCRWQQLQLLTMITVVKLWVACFFFLLFFSTRSLLWFEIELSRCVRSMEHRNCLLLALVIIARTTWNGCLASTAKFSVSTWMIKNNLHSWNLRHRAKLSKLCIISISWKWMDRDFEWSSPNLRRVLANIDVRHRVNVRARPITTIRCRLDSGGKLCDRFDSSLRS